jgi:hypothetical protein
MPLPVYGKFNPKTVKLGNNPCSSLHDGCALFMANSNKQQLKYEMFHEDSLLVSQPSTCCNSGHPTIIFGRTPVHSTHVKNIGHKKFQSPYNSSHKLNKQSMNSSPIWKSRNFHDTSRCYKRQMVECSQTICIWKIHKWM